MKIAVAQITTDPGKIEENKRKIISGIESARALGAQLVVFPELSLPGYGLMDLAFNQSYIDDNLAALEEIRQHTEGIAAVVGFIDQDRDKTRAGNVPVLYNSAAVFSDRLLLGVQDKTLLPDYDIFSENRYFVSGRRQAVFEIGSCRTGIQICEDLWDSDYPVKVTDRLVAQGADTIVNISASPFNTGKPAERRALIQQAIKKHSLNFIYTNLVGSFDGYEGEVVFDGRSLIYGKNSGLIAAGRAFREDLLCADLDRSPPVSEPEMTGEQELYEALILGIKDYFRRLSLKKAFIGLSGGIDSAVVACLAVSALGAENVTAITMPSHITADETRNDALLLAENLGINCRIRSIAAEYRVWEDAFKESEGRLPGRLTRQNKQARLRGSILMEYTNEVPGSIVLTTGNKTELALGYCTLYGDMCGGLAVISDLSKERVYKLAEFINSGKAVIPPSVISRVPTAELEEGQTDRDNLPADYPVLSPLVDLIVEEGLSAEKLSQSFPPAVVSKTLHLINLNEFKRRQAAPGIRVTKHAFGIGRRVPIGNSFIK